MAKGIEIKLNIPGLRQAKEDLKDLNKQFEDAKKRGDDEETKRLAKEYNSLSKEIDKTTDKLLEMNKAGKLVGTKFDDLNEVLFDTQQEILPLTSQIGEMEDRMYQLAAAGDTSSQEFKALQTETVRLRKVIIETDKSVDLLAENQGLAIFGEGLGNVGANIAKLNFVQAEKDARNMSDAVKNSGGIAGKSIKSLAGTFAVLGGTILTMGKTLAANPIFIIAVIVVGVIAAIAGLLAAFGKLKTVLDALYNVTIGPLIDAFKALTDWMGLTTHAENEAIAASKQREAAIKKEIAALDKQIEAEKKMHSERMGQLNSELELARERGEGIEKAQARVDKASIEGLEKDKANFIAKKKLQLKSQEELAARLFEQAKMEDKGVEKMKGSNRDYRKQLEQNSKLRKQIAEEDFAITAEFENKISIIREQAWNRVRERYNEIKGAFEETQKENYEKYKEYQQRRIDAARQIQDLELELMAEGTEKDLAAINIKYDRLIEDTKLNENLKEEEKEKIVRYYESLRAAEEGKRLQEDLNRESKKQAELEKIIREAKEAELATIEEYQEAAYQSNLSEREREEEALRTKYENQLALVREYGEDETEILKAQKREQEELDKKYRDKEIEYAKNARDARIQLASDTFGTISSITELFGKNNEANAKKAFQVNKAAQIAQATISTYQAAQGAYASQLSIPTPDAPIRAAIAAGIAVASGLANVAKIAATKFEGGSAPSGGGGGGSAPSIGGGGSVSTQASSPNFNLFGQSNALNEAQSATSTESTQNIQVQAVVSETEITSTQQTVNNIQQNAEL